MLLFRLIFLSILFCACKKSSFKKIYGTVNTDGLSSKEGIMVVLRYWMPAAAPNNPYFYDTVYTDKNGGYKFNIIKRQMYEHEVIVEQKGFLPFKMNIDYQYLPYDINLMPCAYYQIKLKKLTNSSNKISISGPNIYMSINDTSTFEKIIPPSAIAPNFKYNLFWSISNKNLPLSAQTPTNTNTTFSVSARDTLTYNIEYY